MFEAEIQKYVKEGHKALPCKAAKNAFDRYIETVIHDITENDPNCTFEDVLEQIGEKPKTAAEDFLESQPADVIAVWKHQEKTKKAFETYGICRNRCTAGYCNSGACADKWCIDYKYRDYYC